MWLERLLPLGVTTIQLRVKDLPPAALNQEIAAAVALAKGYGARLFINDHWQLAIEHGAYGVHLGQEDMTTASRVTLLRAGLRLGLSTHSFSEAATALAWRPSYIALGPVFPTTAKVMPFAPQGVARLRQWCRMVGCPVVAIGGIRLEQAPSLIEAGASGIAVISDILSHAQPEQRGREWLKVWDVC
jgi:thiamine-phosphate diphosphorylase